MSAWDEAAVVDAMARAACRAYFYCDLDKPDGQERWSVQQDQRRIEQTAALTALAPHLAARDAAVRREALQEAARCVEGLCDPGTPASSVTTVRKHAANIIRALATDATP